MYRFLVCHNNNKLILMDISLTVILLKIKKSTHEKPTIKVG